ncbi:MAG: hypothetical protein ACT4P5_03690 [Armatimonadota bacterium]
MIARAEEIGTIVHPRFEDLMARHAFIGEARAIGAMIARVLVPLVVSNTLLHAGLDILESAPSEAAAA